MINKTVSNNEKIEVGQNLKALRKSKGITQKELAKRANISDSQITKIERGERSLTKDNAEIFAKILEVDPEEFFDVDVQANTRESRHVYTSLYPLMFSLIEEMYSLKPVKWIGIELNIKIKYPRKFYKDNLIFDDFMQNKANYQIVFGEITELSGPLWPNRIPQYIIFGPTDPTIRNQDFRKRGRPINSDDLQRTVISITDFNRLIETAIIDNFKNGFRRAALNPSLEYSWGISLYRYETLPKIGKNKNQHLANHVLKEYDEFCAKEEAEK